LFLHAHLRFEQNGTWFVLSSTRTVVVRAVFLFFVGFPTATPTTNVMRARTWGEFSDLVNRATSFNVAYGFPTTTRQIKFKILFQSLSPKIPEIKFQTADIKNK
jgi:hypothetical protein